MDVVRSTLSRVGGTVEATSEAGHGTVFRISVTLTLAFIPSLIVWCGGGRYAVPQVEVQEVLHLDAAQVADTVDDVDGARLHRLRGRLVPLVDLAGQLGVTAAGGEGLTIVVVDAGGRRFGLIVDSVGDTTEAVVKPLSRATRSNPLFGGVTILSDGRLSLILDVAGISVRAGLVTMRVDEGDDAQPSPVAATSGLLLATGEDGGRLAVPMARVERLEQLQRAAVERSGPLDVVQYRDSILPVVRVAELLPERRAVARATVDPDESGDLQVVVCSTQAGRIGFVVRAIEDVVDEPSLPSQPASRRGVLASIVVDGRVTEVLDVDVLAADAGVRASS
jgi:two-component system chemotaxis sensor kinase CheA